MIVVFTSSAATLDVPLTVLGVSYPADGQSASWTLLNSQMEPVAGLVNQAVALPAGATVAPVHVPATGHSKTTDIESRFLRLSWSSNGSVRQTHLGYIIIDWAPVAATPDDARRLLGASKVEVPDGDLNVWKAWLELRDRLGTADAIARLTASDDRARRMNEAIACRAALNVAQYMILRLASRMSSETLTFQRFANIDLHDLVRNLGALENSLLFPETADSEAAPAAFFQLSGLAADVITGG